VFVELARNAPEMPRRVVIVIVFLLVVPKINHRLPVASPYLLTHAVR
jgi:hypothetical protein